MVVFQACSVWYDLRHLKKCGTAPDVGSPDFYKSLFVTHEAKRTFDFI